MSVIVSAHVWMYSRAQGLSFTMMLALADIANDQGTGIRAGRAHLAAKARVRSLKTVDRLCAELCLSKELILTHKGGAGPRDVNKYAVDLDLLRSLGPVDGLQVYKAKGVSGTPIGAEAKGVETPAKGVSADTPNPSLDPSNDDDEKRTVTRAREIAQELSGVVDGKNRLRLAVLFAQYPRGVVVVRSTVAKVYEEHVGGRIKYPGAMVVTRLKDAWEAQEGERVDAWDVADGRLITLRAKLRAQPQEN